MATFFFSIFVGGPTLMLLVMVIIGGGELMTTRRLRKHGERIAGQLEDIALKSGYPRRVYGKVRFTYRVNERTYTQKQTVDRDTALTLLSRQPANSLRSGPMQIIVLFLPKRPALARLAIAPSGYMRVVGCVVALIVLGVLAALILAVVLASVNMQPDYQPY